MCLIIHSLCCPHLHSSPCVLQSEQLRLADLAITREGSSQSEDSQICAASLGLADTQLRQSIKGPMYIILQG